MKFWKNIQNCWVGARVCPFDRSGVEFKSGLKENVIYNIIYIYIYIYIYYIIYIIYVTLTLITYYIYTSYKLTNPNSLISLLPPPLLPFSKLFFFSQIFSNIPRFRLTLIHHLPLLFCRLLPNFSYSVNSSSSLNSSSVLLISLFFL